MKYINPPEHELWTGNAVANGTASRYWTGPHEGTLSIKSMVSGQGEWSTPNGRFRVDSDAFLVVNHGQSYCLEVASRERVETFAVFFRPGFVEELRAARNLTDEGLLGQAVPATLWFYERLSPKRGQMQRALRSLYQTVHQPGVEDAEIEDRFVDLACALIDDQEAAKEEALRLDLARGPVREEVHRRLSAARDCLLSSSREKLDLASVAKEACLSPYYFHRLFVSAFGQTPHQFLTEARVSRATTLLKSSEKPVWEVAMDVGFESASHFCRAYRKATGHRPTEVRQTPQD